MHTGRLGGAEVFDSLFECAVSCTAPSPASNAPFLPMFVAARSSPKRAFVYPGSCACASMEIATDSSEEKKDKHKHKASVTRHKQAMKWR